jgi:hypothetical protein
VRRCTGSGPRVGRTSTIEADAAPAGERVNIVAIFARCQCGFGSLQRLFLERCVTEVELLEILELVYQGRVALFHTRSSLVREEKRAVPTCIARQQNNLSCF